MIRQIKAELLKIFSIRSTYVTLAFALAITVFFAFYIEGFKTTAPVINPAKLVSEVTSAVSALAFLISLVGVLLVTHEYRYNTIMYSLTSSNSRLKVLIAKVVAVSCFAVLATLFFAALSPVLTYAGLHLKGISLVHQSIPVADLFWRVAFYGWAYSMLAVLLAFIIRNQVGAIVTILFLPNTVEALLGLLLKKNVVYLPFSALNTLMGGGDNPSTVIPMSHAKAAVIVTGYVVAALIIAAYLFKRRDAN
jgi:ABC-2 type transport system permease protein